MEEELRAEMVDLTQLKNISKEDLEWLKVQYSDVCSGGDVRINQILNDLLAKTPIVEMNEKNYEKCFIDHILESHKDCLKGEDPDPFWAD